MTADLLARCAEIPVRVRNTGIYFLLLDGEAARQLGVPPGNLSEWLNDKYEPSLASLRDLAEHLDCSVASLIGDGAVA